MGIKITGLENDISLSFATQAHNNVSFDPEKRGASIVADYVRVMRGLASFIEENAKEERQEAIAQEVFDRLRDKYKSRVMAWLSAKSRCASSFIVGGSGFNVRRAEKRNLSEHNRMGEVIALEGVMERYALKALNSVFSKAEKTQDELSAMRLKLQNAETAQEFMKAANAAHRKGDDDTLRALFNDRYEEKSEERFRSFLKPSCFGAVGFKRWQLSNNLANIKRMRERLAILEKKAAPQDSREQELNGLRIIRNHNEDRLQLIFEAIPSEVERATLKRNGFKWSPRFKAWQRQLTANAEWTLAHCILKGAEFSKYGVANV